MSMKEYYTNKDNYKPIYKKKYDVTLYRPSIGTVIHNIFTGDVEKTSTYIPFVLSGPLGDERIISWDSLQREYEGVNGEPITGILNKLKLNEQVKIVYKNINKKYFVTMVPYKMKNVKLFNLLVNATRVPLNGEELICKDYELALQRAELRESFKKLYVGALQKTDIGYDYYVQHGNGDYIVCEALPDGSEPDFQTATCVNGSLFEQIFDMRYVSQISVNLYSILVEVELRKCAQEGFTLINSNEKIKDFQYSFVADNNLATNHSSSFSIKTNNKTGKLVIIADKTTKEITAYVNSLGNKQALMPYLLFKTKYLELCAKKGKKEPSSLNLLILFIEKLVTDAANLIYSAEIQVSKEAEELVNKLKEATLSMFQILGQGEIKNITEVDKNGYKLIRIHYMHSLYGILSISGLKIRLSDCTVEACIYDTNTKREVNLVGKTVIQSETGISQFVNRYKTNLVQVVSGSAFAK